MATRKQARKRAGGARAGGPRKKATRKVTSSKAQRGRQGAATVPSASEYPGHRSFSQMGTHGGPAHHHPKRAKGR